MNITTGTCGVMSVSDLHTAATSTPPRQPQHHTPAPSEEINKSGDRFCKKLKKICTSANICIVCAHSPHIGWLVAMTAPFISPAAWICGATLRVTKYLPHVEERVYLSVNFFVDFSREFLAQEFINLSNSNNKSVYHHPY